jgi:hypothetical protein
MTAVPPSAPPPPPPPGGGVQQSAIVVKTRVFPLAFLLYLFKTLVTVDGTTWTLPWGEHTFPVAPGTHQVGIAFKYIFGPTGANQATVQVAPGQVVQVDYRSPFIVFMKGKLTLA